jgi:hypothetical protein
MRDRFFSTLDRELAERASRATISQIGPASRPLLRHLQDVLSDPDRPEERFLGRTVFEALFDWERIPEAFGNLDFIHPRLMEAMDAHQMILLIIGSPRISGLSFISSRHGRPCGRNPPGR